MTKDLPPPVPPISPALGIAELSERARDIFRQIVESYLETGEPVGSRTISQRSALNLSPASIRNVMADLEDLGLLHAPHTSAGRLPTQAGLRLFVDAMLEIGNLPEGEQRAIEAQLGGRGQSLPELLTQTSAMLAGLSACASLVISPKADRPLKHAEFVSVAPGQALVVLVADDGSVENRLVEVPLGVTPSALAEATNYLNARLRGRTLAEARAEVLAEVDTHRLELDALAARLIETGLATWSGPEGEDRALIVRGVSQLLANGSSAADLERTRMLFDDIERKEELLQVLDMMAGGQGVRVFIGSENRLFSLTGSSVVLAPFKDARSRLVGAIGVIGPTRLNYARIVPLVDYTAKLIGRLMGERG